MAENCKTEIRKGTVYQSWDWDKSFGQRTEFKNLELTSGGPWNTGLQGGDSKWQQEVWNCQTKVENFAEFELCNIEELNSFNLTTLLFGSIILSESWFLKRIIGFSDFIKIYETLGFKLKTKFDESLKLDESTKLDVKTFQSDLISLTDSLKYIIINCSFNGGFFKLGESLKLNSSVIFNDSLNFSDSLLVNVWQGYGASGYGAVGYGG